MGWDAAPPNADELKQAKGAAPSWDTEPPRAEELKAQDSGAGQTALENFGDTATFGHLSQLQAATEPAMNWALDKVTGGTVSEGDQSSYVGRRDANTKRRDAMSAENPKAAMAGKVGGVVATLPMLSGAAPAATFAGRAVQAAKGGATAGALMNPGDVEGEVSNPLAEISERGKNALKGAGTGVLAQGALEKVASPIAGWVGSKLGRGAEKMATKALGPTKAQLEKLKTSGQEGKLGRELLDEGAIPAVGSTNGILNRVSAKKDEIGKKIGALLDGAGDAKVISGKSIADGVSQADDVALLVSTPGAGSMRAKVNETLNDILAKGDLSVRDAHELRRQIDKLINFSKRSDELRGMQPVYYAIRDQLNDAISGAVNQVPGVAKDQLKRLNGAYSKMATAERIAEGATARAGANRTISLTDTIAGAAGALAGDSGPERAVLSGAFALANKGARTFGRTSAARGMNAASKAASGTSRVIQRGAESPAAQAMIARMTAGAQSKGFQKADAPPAELQDPKVLGIFRKNPALIDQITDPKVRDQIRSLLDRQPSGQ